jgi:hypothetical protein
VTQQKPNRSTAARYLKIFLLVISLASHKTSKAQEQLNEPASVMLTKFNFVMLTGGIVIVQARLSDFPDTLNFILDTGSGGISLDSSTVAYLKLPVVATDRTIRGIAGIKKISFVLQQTLHLPGLDVRNLDFHINDYDILSSVYGIRIDGIIGYSFLSRYIVKVNYDMHELQVWTQGQFRYPRGGHMLRPQIANLPVIGATIEDARTSSAKYFFDSGAGLCFLLTEQFEADSMVLKKRKKITLTQGEGLGGKKAMRLTTIKSVKVGPYKFRKVPTHLFDDEFKLTNYPDLAGLVGNDLLRRFNVVINYEKREMHLTPNSHFQDPFDYSYTGLGIYMVDGDVVVEDVIPGSPGEKAGLKPGDKIIGIDNNFTGNIQAYRTMLQSTNSRLKLLVMRNGSISIIHLVVRSIL